MAKDSFAMWCRTLASLAAMLLTAHLPGRARAAGAVPVLAPPAVAAPAPPSPVPPPPPAPPPPAVEPATLTPPPAAATDTRPAPDPDATLKRVLSSGCRDGLADVYALGEGPSAPWAQTVLRLCGEILRRPAAGTDRAPAATLTATALRAQHDPWTQEGRGRLVLWSSLYGLWLGIATDVLFDVKGSKPVILPPLIGMGGGLALSLGLTADRPITTGQAWTVITGLDYGSINGAFWAGALDFSTKGVVGTAVTTGVAAGAVGLAVADAANPSAGDIEAVRSGVLWGGLAGFLSVAATSGDPFDKRTAFLSTAVAMDAGFLVGLGIARKYEASRNRVLIIDAGALFGSLTGLGIAWLAVSDTGNSRRTLAGLSLTGLIAGLAIATYATRNLDSHDGDRASFASTPTIPALWARAPDGHWTAGTPSPLPVWDPTGRHLAGAAFNALGGTF
jgi:hypothetical protein